MVIKKIPIQEILITLLIIFVMFVIWNQINNDNIEYSKEEQEKIKIDEYNFGQLEKIKEAFVLNSGWKRKIDSLGYFVFEYGINIVPIKNCYYVSNSNWKYDFIIWFKLESDKYIKKNWSEYYAYPKYDIETNKICIWRCDIDANRQRFETLVSNPCKWIIRWLFYEDRNRNSVYNLNDSMLFHWNSIFLDLNNDWIYWNYEPRSEFINGGIGDYNGNVYWNYEFKDLEKGVYTLWVVNKSNYRSYTQPNDWKYVVEINNDNLFIKDIDFWVYKEGSFH